MKYCFLTFHGCFLGRSADGTLLHQITWDEIAEPDRLIWLDLPPRVAERPYAAFIADIPRDTVVADFPGLEGANLRLNLQGRFIGIQRGALFLSAQDDGAVLLNRENLGAWEQFVPLSEDDMKFLALIREHRWIIKSSREVVPAGAARLGEDHSLLLGGIAIPLGYNMPFDTSRAPFRLTVLLDGWRIEEIILLRPLIYYVALGEDHILSQLYTSLNSLGEIGDYDGQVLVFTDRGQREIVAAAPGLQPAQLSAVKLPASDWVGYVAGKYSILEQQAAYAYQPVVYMDPDIVFNANVQPMLVDMAVSERLTAPIEEFSTLAHNPSVGASLLQLDNAQPRYMCGFNGGTIGIPNLPHHRHTVQLIRRIIRNYLAIKGRQGLRWVDQEVANYVSYKIANFDLSQVSKYVRYGDARAAAMLGPLTGLVHFWPIHDRQERAAGMLRYLNLLRAHKAGR
jgi:hypothetical protein